MLALVISACKPVPEGNANGDNQGAMMKDDNAMKDDEAMEDSNKMEDVMEKTDTAMMAAPSFDVTTVSGKQVALESNVQMNKPTIVYFMASWCSTCAKNWDALDEVLPEYEDKVDFVAISVDPTDTDDVLMKLAQEKGLNFEMSAGNPQLALDYDVKKQTAKFAINAKGEIVERHDGAMTADEWRAFFNKALGDAMMEEVTEKTDTPTLAAAPDFDVTTVSGKQVALESNVQMNKPTIVYFMASTCTTCAKNWDALDEVLPEYEDKVDFVAISVDPTDTNDVLMKLAEDRGLDFEMVSGSPDLALAYDVKKQTAKFAINADGEIVERNDGALTADEWRAFIEKAL